MKRTAVQRRRNAGIGIREQLPFAALAFLLGAQACASEKGATGPSTSGSMSTAASSGVAPATAASSTGPSPVGPTGSTGAGTGSATSATGAAVTPSNNPVNPGPTGSTGGNPDPTPSVTSTTSGVAPDPTSAATSTDSTTTTSAGTSTATGASSETMGPTGSETTSEPVDVSPGNGTALLEEDFEGYATGAPPDGYDLFVGWVYNPATISGPEVVEVDSSKAHGGSNALHIKGGSNPAQLAWDIPAGNTRLYVRSWVYLTNRKLGNNADGNHETLIALRRDPTGANSEIRFGEIKGAVGTNEVPTDAVSPPVEKWNTGPEIPNGQWVCIEVAFLADLPFHELHAWADGELVHSVTKASDWHAPVPDAWMGTSLAQIVFGWHSFSSFNEELWFDDIVIATDRVGCD